MWHKHSKLITRTHVCLQDGPKRVSAFSSHALVSCCSHSLTQLAVPTQASHNNVSRDLWWVVSSKKQTLKITILVLVNPFSKGTIASKTFGNLQKNSDSTMWQFCNMSKYLSVQLCNWKLNIEHCGSGCGSVSRVAASNTRDPRFKYRHQQKYYLPDVILNRNTGKRGREWPIFRKTNRWQW